MCMSKAFAQVIKNDCSRLQGRCIFPALYIYPLTGFHIVTMQRKEKKINKKSRINWKNNRKTKMK